MDQSLSEITWPPPYRIKKHRLAKHVKLRTVRPCQLEITVPYRFNLREIPSILEENKLWIIKQLSELSANFSDTLPDVIHFSFNQTKWLIEYMACQSKLELIHRSDNQLVLIGDIANESACKSMLLHWVRAQAKQVLSAQLALLSQQTQLAYKKVVIRKQQTLWGSCSVDKVINLNYCLLFLPFHLATHVMIHELCHTIHLNHSERFWNLVASYDPCWRENRRALRKADQFVPSWILC